MCPETQNMGGCQCNVVLLLPCMGQHVPGPLNHLSGGVITALWDTTQPSNTQGALQRRHLLRKYSQRGSCREGNTEKGGGSGWGRRGVGIPVGKFEVNPLNFGWQSNIAERVCVCVKKQGWGPGLWERGLGWQSKWEGEYKNKRVTPLQTVWPRFKMLFFHQSKEVALKNNPESICSLGRATDQSSTHTQRILQLLIKGREVPDALSFKD